MSLTKAVSITIGLALTLISSLAFGGFYNSHTSENNMRAVTGYSGNGVVAWGLYEIFDINDDGFDDLVFGAAINDEKTNFHSPTEFVKPVIFFWDTDSNSYKIDEDVQDKLPEMHWPRRAIGSKNPLTNEVELFIADHGLDGGHAPNCGAPNKIIRFKGGKVASVVVPFDVNDYSHGMASADLNGDGRLDHIVVNSPFIKREKCGKGKFSNDSYLLLSEGTEDFKRKKIEFKSKSFGRKPYYDAASVVEIDGVLHFVGGRGSYPKIKLGIDIFEMNLNGKFTPKQFIPAPKIMKREPSYSEVVVDTKEPLALFAALAETDMNWRGRFIQRLEWDGTKFVDASEKVQQINPQRQGGETMPDWCTLLSFVEWNGADYITCSSFSPFLQGRPKIYMRDGEKIIAVPNDKKSASFHEWTNREVNPIRHGDQTKLVAWDFQPGKHPVKGEAWEGILINVIEYRP